MRLAVVTSHPIQYYSPWYQYLARTSLPELKVFYLWDFGVTRKIDSGFNQPIQWNIPLLEGYQHEFVPNVSRKPGTSHVRGLINPTLAEDVAKFGADIVLLMGYNFESLYKFLWTWGDRTPILLRGDSHRLVRVRNAKEALKRAFISFVFRRFAGFLYVGKANRDYYTYHGVPDSKLFFAPHAIDNDRFFNSDPLARNSGIEWRRSLGIRDNHTVVLFAGKFEQKKRPLDLLKAFVDANVSDSTLLFVGSGKLESELRRASSGRKDIVFAPFQNQTEMPMVYDASDLLVLPSFGPSETWGLAVNEAMCVGRPVIVSSHVGCAQDLVHSGRNGLVFPAGDVRALADALRNALSNRSRLNTWGHESTNIISGFNYQRATDGLLAALTQLVPHAVEVGR